MNKTAVEPALIEFLASQGEIPVYNGTRMFSFKLPKDVLKNCKGP